MSRVVPLFTLALCGLLAGCVQPVNSERVDWGHGARYGRVLDVLAPQAAADEARACLGAGAALPAAQQYVRVRYRATHLHHKVLAVIESGPAAHAGDEVELWPGDCATGHLARVSRVLPPLPPQS